MNSKVTGGVGCYLGFLTSIIEPCLPWIIYGVTWLYTEWVCEVLTEFLIDALMNDFDW